MNRPIKSLACTLLCAILALSACEEEKVAEKAEVIKPVRALKIGDATILNKRWFSGRAKATKEVVLSFRIAGPLIDLSVEVGDQVKKDAVLAKIDPATFKTEVDQTAANVSRSQASLKNSRLQLERQQTLFEKGHVAAAALDKYIAAEGEYRAEVRAHQAALKKAKLDLSYATLQAPFSGVVVATYVENFEDVQTKQRVLRLLDPTQIEMVVNIPENLISLAPQVKEVLVIFDAFPDQKITATIKEVGAEASETTRTYPVTIVMNQPEGMQILPGMAGKATGKTVVVPVGAAEEVEVPVAAAFGGTNGQSLVWIIDEGSMRVTQRQVTTSSLTNQGIKITDGLRSGEWVVTAGVNALKEGQKIRILEDQGTVEAPDSSSAVTAVNTPPSAAVETETDQGEPEQTQNAREEADPGAVQSTTDESHQQDAQAVQSPAVDTPIDEATIVFEIQNNLSERGFDVGRPDGMFGPRTGAAIEAYQQRNGLPVDGTPTIELLRHLESQ